MRTLFTEVFPGIQRDFATDGEGHFHSIIAVSGEGTFTVSIRGREVTVHDGEREDRPQFRLHTTREAVQLFLDDWSGPGRFLPKFAPAGDLLLFTDPKMLRRLAMVQGSIELALLEADGSRIAMSVACGPAARSGDRMDSPDAFVEAPVSVFEALLAGRLAPEDALVDRQVSLRGKRLVAMQLAFAFAPFFPKL